MLYTLSCPWRLGKQANYMKTLWGGLSYSVPWQTLGILCPSLWGLHNNHLTWGNLLPNLQMSEKKYQLRVTIKLFAHCEREKKKRVNFRVRSFQLMQKPVHLSLYDEYSLGSLRMSWFHNLKSFKEIRRLQTDLTTSPEKQEVSR